MAELKVQLESGHQDYIFIRLMGHDIGLVMESDQLMGHDIKSVMDQLRVNVEAQFSYQYEESRSHVRDVEHPRAPRKMNQETSSRVRGNPYLFDFPVDVGLHQGSTISPYLFVLILDELSRGIQESIPWCLISAYDIVLVSETPEGLNERLEQWRETLEDKGLRVSREKTEYLLCNFNMNEDDQNEEAKIRIGEHILESNESFRYLGSLIHKSKIEDDVTHRIQAG
ncbi:retrovirus-related pol polyprotein LINE-1 [Tanacetum coccineum]